LGPVARCPGFRKRFTLQKKQESCPGRQVEKNIAGVDHPKVETGQTVPKGVATPRGFSRKRQTQHLFLNRFRKRGGEWGVRGKRPNKNQASFPFPKKLKSNEQPGTLGERSVGTGKNRFDMKTSRARKGNGKYPERTSEERQKSPGA